MTEVFQDYDSLLSRLRLLIEELSPKLIGIEGCMSSGKSHLAHCLGPDLNASVVETDGFSLDLLHPEQASSARRTEPYIYCLDIDVLAATLTNVLASRPLVIIESICLGDVLARVGRQVDLSIYLKVIAQTGLWHDGIHLENYESGRETFGHLHRDEMEYHSRVRPHEKADLILVRVEDEPWPEGAYVAKR